MKKLWKLCRTALALALVFSLTLSLCANGLTVFATENTDTESRKDAILKEFFGDGVSAEEAFDKLLAETETMNGYVNKSFCYVPDRDSYYVAFGDETAAITTRQASTYVDKLADALDIPYKNLAQAQMTIQEVYAVIADNSSLVAKADLITLGFSNYGATYYMCKYMAGQSSKVTEAQWIELVGEENMPMLQELLNEMFGTLREDNLSNFGGYDLEGGLECYAYAYMSNAIHQSQVIEAIREINTDAAIVLVGTYNDLESISLDVNGEMMDLGDMMLNLVNASNFLSTKNAAAYGRVAYVDAPDVTTTLDKNASKYTTPKQYVLAIVGRQGLPTAAGHEYIRDQIKNAMSSTCSHIWDEGTVTTAATCSKEGVRKFTCTWCGNTKTEAIPATGEHKLATREDNQKAPTCGKDGFYDLVTYCTECGTVTKIENKTVPATGNHNYTSEVTIEAGCESAGLMTYTCTVCGDSYTKEISPTGHNYTKVVTKPTCTEGGYTTYTCACGDSYVADKTDALGHSFGDWTQSKAPSCTEEGEEHRECTRCGHVETQKVPVTAHNHVAVVTLPTCTTGGYTTYTCACGDSYVADKTDALGHSFSDWTQSKAPSCTEEGEERRECTRCGEVETRSVAVVDHTYESVVTRPTCTEGGYTTYTCSVCNHSYVADKVSPLGHVMETETTDATCCEDGVIYRVCTICGEEETEVIPATADHVLIYEDNKNGVDHRILCQNSGKELVANEQHTFVDGICAQCGAEASCVHQWGDGIVTLAPTCSATGEKSYTCELCGETYSETLPVDPASHTGNNHVENAKDATCTETGYTGDTVCECGAVISAGEEIAMLEHSYETVVTAPTCTEGGYTTYTCSVCGDSHVADQTEASGHTWDEGVVTKEPTETTDGERTHTCTECGEQKIEIIEKTGDSDVLIGDVNGDGRINARDARALLRYLAGLAEDGEVDLATADFNGDGRINARDARALLQHLAGLG